MDKEIQKILEFRKHLNDSVEELLDELDTKGYDERFNLKLELNGKKLELDLHADLYNRLIEFLDEERAELEL